MVSEHQPIICLFLLILQVVELDFLYPSEGIHRRWDAGYRITSVAATWDQTALVLSIPRRKPLDETQETLRTSAFPSTHVKVYHFTTFYYHLCFSLSLINFKLPISLSFGRRNGQKIFT